MLATIAMVRAAARATSALLALRPPGDIELVEAAHDAVEKYAEQD